MSDRDDDRAIIAYPLSGGMPDIRPARSGRGWMDALPDQFAYRCLPLNIANMLGWEVCAPCRIAARWDGGRGQGAIAVSGDGAGALLPASHFGNGVLTFHVGVLFRTPPGVNLLVTAPLNHPRHGIYGLSGVVETDWSPYSFTMNWQFTAPDITVTWEAGEPFATLIPLQRGLVEGLEPAVRPLDDDPALAGQFRQWSQSRNDFNTALGEPGSAAAAAGWQKDYYRGKLPDGGEGCPDHQTKLHPRPFPRPIR